MSLNRRNTMQIVATLSAGAILPSLKAFASPVVTSVANSALEVDKFAEVVDRTNHLIIRNYSWRASQPVARTVEEAITLPPKVYDTQITLLFSDLLGYMLDNFPVPANGSQYDPHFYIAQFDADHLKLMPEEFIPLSIVRCLVAWHRIGADLLSVKSWQRFSDIYERHLDV